MDLPDTAFPEGWAGRPPTASQVTSTSSEAGVMAGWFGIAFGLLGIFSIGFIFVPVAAICSFVGLAQGLSVRSRKGLGVSLVGSILSFWGALVSPSVWALLAGGVLTGSLMPTASVADYAVSSKPSPAPIIRTVPHVQTAAALAPQLPPVPRVARVATAASEPEIIRDPVSGQALRIFRLLRMSDVCDTSAEVSGRVLSRDVPSPSAQPVGIAIQASQGRRLFINVDTDLNSYSRDTAKAVADGLRDLTQTGRQVTVQFKSCGGSGRPYLDSIAQAPTAPAGAAITTSQLKQCSRTFLRLWNDDREVAFARLPKSPCLMPGETGAYVCDQGGCVRISAWEAAQKERR